MKNKLVIVVIIAFILRLIALSQSLWLDETTSARVVSEYSYQQIIQKFSPTDFHPPLYYLLLKLWTSIFGLSEISLRFPSIIFSLLTGLLIYLIGKKMHSKELGFWASVFFLFNPLVVYYSQEARMYIMATFLLTTSFYYFLKISNLKSKIILNTIFFSLFSSLSFLTFYGSLFFIITILIYLLFKKRYKYFFISFLFLLFSFLITSPLLYQQFSNAQKQLVIVLNWQQVLGKANIKNLLLIFLKFSFGRISFHPKVIYYLISGLWTVFIFYYAFVGGFKNKRLFFFFTAPIILGLIFSFFTPLFSYFRFLYLLPIFSLFLSYGVKKRRLRLIIISGFVILSLVYLLNPVFHREDWKKLSQHLTTSERIYMIASSSDPIKYYRKDIIIYNLQELKNTSDKKIIVVPYSADIYGIDYQKILKDRNYQLENKKTFRGLIIENWSLN